MLYFLIFLAPFALVMGYLIRENKQFRHTYRALYQRIWVLSDKAKTSPRMRRIEDLDNIVTDGTIKIMEMDLIDIETKLGMARAQVVSNKFGPKLKKLQVLTQRIKQAEKQAEAVAVSHNG